MNPEIDFSQVDRIYVAPHKDKMHATVSFSVGEVRVRVIGKLENLPVECRQAGEYCRRGGQWTRLIRVDGEQGVMALKALFGNA